MTDRKYSCTGLRRVILAGLVLLFLPRIEIRVESFLPSPSKKPVVAEAPAAPLASPSDYWQQWIEFRERVMLESMARVVANHPRTKITYDEALVVVRQAHAQSQEYSEVDIFRILGFMLVESGYNRTAISHAGAMGFMQIMPATGRFIAGAKGHTWPGKHILLHQETNLSYGVWYYHHLLEYYDGDDYAAVAAYNWGPENINWRRANGHALPRVYPGKVLAAERWIRERVYDEARVHFWRSAYRLERNQRQPWDRLRTQDRSTSEQVSITARESLLPSE